ncbi:hypothetical protein MEE_01497 [Bartonella elizabethae F9251 = ATCC 49927]|uniref:Uncharacterized protein n=1 Tax=Bartonella elizabethae F9251 = ATCC 49927 TaxID=1094555 RepID=J0ZWH0_BAREL|nr:MULTISPECIES: hypothetical protein [Bartonella]EJF93378.1 hypothetical protein MEE_01497 [Bartonella elizabethae F9251 = ATCC 49927]VEJ41839.1 Uncharacterised protein [Bartonella elizabethae]
MNPIRQGELTGGGVVRGSCKMLEARKICRFVKCCFDGLDE